MLRAIVYGPKAEEGVLQGPVYVYFHGGGWTFGMPEYGEGIAEGLVKELGVSVVSVGYRLGPENVFPAAVEDASDAVRWVSVHMRLSILRVPFSIISESLEDDLC